MAAVKYGMMMNDNGMPLLLSVYANDGTVTVVQSGVEMGQGLYMMVQLTLGILRGSKMAHRILQN